MASEVSRCPQEIIRRVKNLRRLFRVRIAVGMVDRHCRPQIFIFVSVVLLFVASHVFKKFDEQENFLISS